MRSTDCESCKVKSIWMHPAAAGPFYWHIRWDIGGEIGLICFSCHPNGRSLSRGKALTGLRSRWANSQGSFIGFLLQTLCLMRTVACKQKPDFKKTVGKKSPFANSLSTSIYLERVTVTLAPALRRLIFSESLLKSNFGLEKTSPQRQPAWLFKRLSCSSSNHRRPLAVSRAALAPWLRFHLEVTRCQTAARAPRRWQHN